MDHSIFFKLLDSYADNQSQQVAIEAGEQSVTWGELTQSIQQRIAWLKERDVKRLALLADNSSEWILWDLAAMKSGTLIVPLPTFFSPSQLNHILNKASIDCVITDLKDGQVSMLSQDPDSIKLHGKLELSSLDYRYFLFKLSDLNHEKVPPKTAKITFTSGTTGSPKGVCLSAAQQLCVAQSLILATDSLQIRKHTCLLPLSTLLENVAGVYAPLMVGGTVQVSSLSRVGYQSASDLDITQFVQHIYQHQADSIVLVPQLLHVLVVALEMGAPQPASLKFIAVGGGHVCAALLARANSCGLPVFQGYGLSENGSVSCLNLPEYQRAGSVGKALRHNDIQISKVGEVLVKGNQMLGYLGEHPPTSDWLPTGDLGYLDQDGYLFIKGRIKNQFITSFGRNINPEWLESELTHSLAIKQALVLGEAKPFNIALIVKRSPLFSDQQIEASISAINSTLPTYAQINKWLVIEAGFTSENGLATDNGRLKRAAILSHYQAQINALYIDTSHIATDSTKHTIGENTMTNFFERLQTETTKEREQLLSLPIIQTCFEGQVSLAAYIAFLTEAFHHVKHTVPLMMASGAKLSFEKEWIRAAIVEYIDEEYGHHEWILNDISACGDDKELARHSQPSDAIQSMISYLYDAIETKNPLCIFGMVWVLEGTSVALASHAASSMATGLSLPKKAFSYLNSHGSLDVEHLTFFENLMNKITDPQDQKDIIESAKVVYGLYGQMLSSLPNERQHQISGQNDVKALHTQINSAA